MARSAVGLDIGTFAVHVAQVAMRRGQPIVTNFGGAGLPRGAVVDGEIVDVRAVADTVERLIRDTGIRDTRVHLGVANQRVVVRQVDLPYLEDEELRSSLRYQVQEYIPMPVEQVELDYERLEEVTGEGDTRMIRLLLVAADRDMVRNHAQVALDAGLRPVAVDLNAFALVRSLVPDPETVPDSEMLIDVGAGVTNLIVHQQGKPRFVRIVVQGGSDVTTALATELEIDPEEAETRKRSEVPPGDPARPIVDDQLATFVDEVRGSLDYYLSQTGASQVGRIIVAGGGSKLPRLLEELESGLRVRVDPGRPLAHIPAADTQYSVEELAALEPLLATAIGLALGGLR